MWSGEDRKKIVISRRLEVLLQVFWRKGNKRNVILELICILPFLRTFPSNHRNLQLILSCNLIDIPGFQWLFYLQKSCQLKRKAKHPIKSEHCGLSYLKQRNGLSGLQRTQTDLCNFLKTNTAYADNVKHNNRAHGNNVFAIWCFTASDSVSVKISSLESRGMET